MAWRNGGDGPAVGAAKGAGAAGATPLSAAPDLVTSCSATDSGPAELDGGPGGSDAVGAIAMEIDRWAGSDPQPSDWVCTLCTWWEISCRSKLARSREMRRLARSRETREWRRQPSTSSTTKNSTTNSITTDSSTQRGTDSGPCEFALSSDVEGGQDDGDVVEGGGGEGDGGSGDGGSGEGANRVT